MLHGIDIKSAENINFLTKVIHKLIIYVKIICNIYYYILIIYYIIKENIYDS